MIKKKKNSNKQTAEFPGPMKLKLKVTYMHTLSNHLNHSSSGETQTKVVK